MQALIIVFIAVTLLIALFCVFVVARDVVIEEKEKRQKRKAAAQKEQISATAAPGTQTAESQTTERKTNTSELS